MSTASTTAESRRGGETWTRMPAPRLIPAGARQPRDHPRARPHPAPAGEGEARVGALYMDAIERRHRRLQTRHLPHARGVLRIAPPREHDLLSPKPGHDDGRGQYECHAPAL